MNNDQLDAIKALTARLREWEVEEPEARAQKFVNDMVARGWRMDAHYRPLRRPPMRSEECGVHPGEFHDFCRACVADRKAVADEVANPGGHWTPERIRESLHAGADLENRP